MNTELMQIYNFLFLFFISSCSGQLHAPLYRVIPPHNIFPEDSAIALKGLQSYDTKSSNKEITVLEMDLKGTTNYGYYMAVGIGTPPQNFNLVVDTGSSNTAIAGARQTYLSTYYNRELSSTFINQNIEIEVPYDSGKWKGFIGSEIFTFDGVAYVDANKKLKYSDPVSVRSNLGVITESKTFFLQNGKFHGILGMAYPILSQPPSLNPKSTLFDDFVRKYGIRNMFSVVLCGHNKEKSELSTSGFFIAGGKNESLYNPPMVDILIYRQWFYEIIIARISIDQKPIILSSCKEYNKEKSILDTGTTDTYFSSHIFHALVSSIFFNMKKRPPFELNNNSPFWERKAVLCILDDTVTHPTAYFPEIQFELVINDTASLEVVLSPQQYIQYVGDQVDGFGKRRNCYKFGIGMSPSGTILGDSFLEGFYFLFDREGSKVGIAQSKCNNHVPGLPRSRIARINNGQQGLLACSSGNALSKSLLDLLTPTMTIIIGILFALILIPSIILLVYHHYSSPTDQEKTNLIDSHNPSPNQVFYNSVK